MPVVLLCLPRSRLRDALDQVQRRQHEHLFRFGLDAEGIALLELSKNVGEQLLLWVVANGVRGDLAAWPLLAHALCARSGVPQGASRGEGGPSCLIALFAAVDDR